MSKLTLRLLTAVIVMASAQSVAALSFSTPIRVTSSASGRISTIGDTSPRTITFQRYTKRADAQDTGGRSLSGGSVTGNSQIGTIPPVRSVLSSVSSLVSPAPTLIDPTPAQVSVPVTAATAVVAQRTTATDPSQPVSDENGVAITPVPAGGILLLTVAGLGLLVGRRRRTA